MRSMARVPSSYSHAGLLRQAPEASQAHWNRNNGS